MIRRTVEISREPCHLAVRKEQLLVLRREEARQPPSAASDNVAGRIPIEDLGVLMVDERDTTYTQTALVKLAEHGAALVVCGRDHLPCGMFVPLSTNTELLGRLEIQLSASKPRQKRLWSALVAGKIRAQAANLAHEPNTRSRLLTMARQVRSGDPNNIEAQAARLYWPALFRNLPAVKEPFRRRPNEGNASAPNNLLNYGYAVIRASIARAIVAAGLLPAIGVQHHNRSNAFCLADDLIEPLRPLVDARVRALAAQGQVTLDRATKATLLGILTDSVCVRNAVGPMGVAVVRYVASFVRVLAAEGDQLDIPVVRSNGAHCGAAMVEEDTDECI